MLAPRLPAVPACISTQVDASGAVAITIAAFLANLFESWLGASAQGRVPWLTNDLVNIIQISLAAGIAVALVTAGPLAA